MTICYSDFPNLSNAPHRSTSNPTSEENCIAHAAGAHGEWWDPAEGRIWPVNPPYDNDKIESLVRVYETLGYVVCDSAEHEPDYEKIAIYGKGGVYEHAARQLIEDGTWTSKLGPEDDINHATLEALADGRYGSVVRIMKRLRSEHEETKCCEVENGAAH